MKKNRLREPLMSEAICLQRTYASSGADLLGVQVKEEISPFQ